MKALLVRFGSAGDILLAKRAISALKNAGIPVTVDFLCKEKFSVLPRLIGADNVLELKPARGLAVNIAELNRVAAEINSRGYSVVIDLHSNLRSRYLMSRVQARSKAVVSKDVIKRRLMVWFKWFTNSGSNVAQRYVEAVKKALPAASEPRVKSVKKKGLSVLLHAGARWPLKRWPYFGALAGLLARERGVKVTVTGLKDEVEKSADLLYIKSSNVKNMIGKTGLKELYLLISKSSLFIGNDTAAAHMAAAAGVPAVVIMGPTIKAFGFTAGSEYTVIEKELFCRPCGLHGKGRCATGTFECMMAITPAQVRDAAMELLKKGKRD